MKKLILIPLFASAIYAGDSWYDKADIAEGKKLFAKNCAVCHGAEGIGPKGDWREKLPNGKMKPPPLNGTAHTWHHKPELLKQIIKTGGETYGENYKGWMPQFKDKLSDKQIDSILKYIHSIWPEKIRNDYDKFFKIK